MQYKKHFVIISIGLLLSGCAGIQLPGLIPAEEIKLNNAYAQAENLAAEAQYLQAAEVLWEASADLSSPRKEELQLESARMLIRGQHLLNAHQRLIVINEEVLEPQAVLDKRILTATFYKQVKQPEKVVLELPEALINEGDDALKKEALMLRADGLRDTHRYVESLDTYISIKELLSEDEHLPNTDKIWQNVIAVNPEDARERLVNEEVDEEINEELKAWLELALLATPTQIDTTQLEQDYQRWIDEHSFLSVPDYAYEDLLSRWAYFDFHPEKITLILPLTGDYASIGRTIRDGFMTARREAQNTSPTASQKAMQIDIYDSNQNQSIVELYQKATREGTDMVVGPLLKENVDVLLKHSPLPTPTITLNYASDAKDIAEGEVFQFGLYPEDEAEQIAEKLLEKEYNSVVVMAADNEWGRRMVRRFSDVYFRLKGTIQDIYYYDTKFEDYAPSVQSLFQLNQSMQRYTDIKKVVGKNLDFRPRIRDDINAAVLFANYQNATLIYPLMKFYYADELPVYASSHAYEPGNEKLLRELDGLVYNDIPFIVDRVRYPDSDKVKELPRLYALGKDAYRLINTIRRIAISSTELDGATGYISADENRRLQRRLNWAKFNKGKPFALVHEQ